MRFGTSTSDFEVTCSLEIKPFTSFSVYYAVIYAWISLLNVRLEGRENYEKGKSLTFKHCGTSFDEVQQAEYLGTYQLQHVLNNKRNYYVIIPHSVKRSDKWPSILKLLLGFKAGTPPIDQLPATFNLTKGKRCQKQASVLVYFYAYTSWK